MKSKSLIVLIIGLGTLSKTLQVGHESKEEFPAEQQ